MQKKSLHPFIIYTAFAALILGWWCVAFKQSESPYTPNISITRSREEQKTEFHQYLTPLNRDVIKRALAGDFGLMTQLMADWDVDARILEDHGLIGVRRLSKESYIKGQLLGRQLKQPGFHKRTGKFLPQTYISATFLLALSQPEEIIGIPEGLRRQTYLFPEELTDQIPINLDRFNSEMIFHSNPDVAFIANYSQPATVQALRNQGIKLCSIEAVNTLPEITSAIQLVGEVVNRPKEAELLTLFMEASMIAIDNHLMLARQEYSPRILFLNHHANYSIPTERTITGHLLQRLQNHGFTFISPPNTNEKSWRVLVDQEKIINYRPDCLIIACSDGPALENQIVKYSPLMQLPALKKNNLFFVDDDIQQTPTQFIVLAYLDLAEALERIHY